MLRGFPVYINTMAYALTEYTGDNSTTEYSIGYSFLSAEHINVTVNGVSKTLNTDFTVDRDAGTMTFTSPPATSAEIVLQRVTPRATVDRAVDFTAGSGLTETDLDNGLLYNLYIAQEILDDADTPRGVDVEDLTDAARLLGSGYAVSTGTSGALALDLTPNLGSFVTGILLTFKAHTNADSAVTLNVDSLGAKAITVNGGNPGAGAIVSGNTYFCLYDGTNFELLNPSASGTTIAPLGSNLDTNGQEIIIDDTHGIIDENGNEQLTFNTTASAVNELEMTNAATGNAPKISAAGGDTNIDLELEPKGTGSVDCGSADVTTTGDLSAAGGTFSGNLGAVDGTFSGDVSGVGGTFSGNLGAVDGTFSGDVSGVGGTFSGNLGAVDGTFSGDVSSADLTATGTPTLSGLEYPTSDGSDGDLLATDGAGTLDFIRPGPALITSGTLGTVTELILGSTHFTSDYDSFELHIRWQMQTSTGTCALTASLDGGSTFETSGYTSPTTNIENQGGDATAGSIQSLVMRIEGANDTSMWTMFTGTWTKYASNAVTQVAIENALEDTSTVNGIRFYRVSGNMSKVVYKLYGYRL